MIEAISTAIDQDISALDEFIEAASQKAGGKGKSSTRAEGVALAVFKPKGLTSKDGNADAAQAAASAGMKLMMSKKKKKGPFG